MMRVRRSQPVRETEEHQQEENVPVLPDYRAEWSAEPAFSPLCEALAARLRADTEAGALPDALSPISTTSFTGAHHDNPSYWSLRTVDGRKVQTLESVCWFECGTELRDVPPGVYAAVWRLRLWKPSSFGGAPMHAELKLPGATAPLSALWNIGLLGRISGWCTLVFPSAVTVESTGTVSSMLWHHGESDPWKAGFGASEFALVALQWSPSTHKMWPADFRAAVRTLLLVNARLGLATSDTLLIIIGHLASAW